MSKKISVILFPILYVVTIIICIYFSYNKGLTGDTGDYFQMAENLPKLTNNIFPLLYSITIYVISLIGLSTFTSSKIVGLICLIIILSISIRNNFYKKEIILTLGFKIFSIFYFSWSEPLFITLFIVYIYLYHQYEEKKISNIKFTFLASTILFLLFITRYSGLFILISLIIYQFWNYLKDKKINYTLIKTTFISGCLSILYLIFNYLNFGNFFGDRKRFELKNTESFFSQVKNNFITFSHAINPIYTEIDYSILAIRISIIISFLFSILFLFQLIKIKNWILNKSFYRFLITNAIVYFLFILITSLNTKIDGLNFRLLLPSIFIFYFLIIINYIENKRNINIIYILIFLSILINTASVIPSFSN